VLNEDIAGDVDCCADANAGLMHTVVGTAAHVNGVTYARVLAPGAETEIFGMRGYQSVTQPGEMRDVQAKWHIAMHSGKRPVLNQDTELVNDSMNANDAKPASAHRWNARSGPSSAR